MRFVFTAYAASSVSLCADSTRFVVMCSCVISALLDDWSGFDLDLTTKYIVDSQRYDGAFAMGPGLEGHGTRENACSTL